MKTSEPIQRGTHTPASAARPASTAQPASAGRPGYDVAGALLAEFEAELATTRKFLERVPADRLGWRPHEKSMTAGQLALHVAQTPLGVLSMALQDAAPPPNFSGGRQQPATVDELLAALDKSAAFVRETLPTLDDRRMADTFRVVADGRELMAVPRAAFLRRILLNHWYHHRGQLGVYLRLCGAKVPPSYGPSGDESPF
jgi:uncharacterized damage-inducible protein DinB